MPSFSQSDIDKKLALLQADFKKSLPEKVIEIEVLWNSILEGNADELAIESCYRMAHTLAGSGGTFGAISVTTISRDLIHALNSIIDEKIISPDIASIIMSLISNLKSAVNDWQPSKIPYIQPLEDNVQRKNNLIYIAEDDEFLAEDLLAQLEQDDFVVKYFNNLDDFVSAFYQEVPAAVIMDVMFKEGGTAGADTIKKLKNDFDKFPPVVFISARKDIEARLASVKAGAQKYFSKPINKAKLSKTLDGLIERTVRTPYRILLVDDDLSLLNYYETILAGAGMEVLTMSNPMNTLDALEQFKPDVIVLDVYMPECSGPEVAQVIRQDDNWTMIPIMFLSVETDLDIQLRSLDLGGESFMVKPLAAAHLVDAVTVKAKKSRWNSRINNDLKLALRESEFQVVTSNQHDIVSSADVTGRIISVNDKFCDISGYSREELIGQNHRLLKSNNHIDSFYKDMWASISSGQIWHGTICNHNKSGEEYWVDSTIVPFLDEKGKPYKYVSARTDITKVLQSEARLELSQTFANIGTWDWDIGSGKLFWSDRIWPLFGYEKEVVKTTYENFMSAIHPEDKKLVSDAVTKCVNDGDTYDIEHRVIWPDGSIHWLHESGDVVRAEDGSPRHMLGVVQDITLRKETEMNLAKQERQLLAAQSMASVGNWQADLSNGNLVWSDEIYRIFGYKPGSFEPSIEAFHKAVHPDDLTMVKESEKKAETTGYHDVEHRILQPDGTVRYVHELAEVEIDKQGHLIKMSGTVQDITERKLAEQAIVLAREEAETANRAKSQFLSSMSHELRTPMNAIMGFAQLLNIEIEQPLTNDQKENVNEILKASDHLLDLINEVLDLSKIEAGRIDLSIEDVSLGESIIQSLQLILPLADKRGISIKLYRGEKEIKLEDLYQENVVVRADFTRIKQVVINFLSNAVKYNSEKGTITIKCEQKDNNIRISVIDTGQGLGEEEQKQLFTAFNRLGAENTDVEGTGIGLVITKNIVELMGGQLGVESEVGVGSTFWFELPCGSEGLSDTAIDNDSTSENSLTLTESQHTVLYIEDNPANLRLVSQLLGRLPNIHMWSAHEPVLGLELAYANNPDLILLDINLPGMDGFEVLELLRKSDITRNTPVIAISANAMPKDVERGFEAGFDDYITKPINIQKLLSAVDDRLNK